MERKPDLDWCISKGAHYIHDKVFVLLKIIICKAIWSINKEDNIHCFFGASKKKWNSMFGKNVFYIHPEGRQRL